MSGKPWWHPDAIEDRLPTLQRRAAILGAIRLYFLERGFDEVETPALQISPGLEPHLKAFATTLEDPLGGGQPLYLHTSPEFAMKKLLAAGLPRIFQIARVFRNGERGAWHHPEFTMLEWYRAWEGTAELMDDCAGLLRASLTAIGAETCQRGELCCDPFADWERLTVAEAFERDAGIDLLATAPDPLAPDRDRLAAAARGIDLHVSEFDRWDDIFFRILLERIEPKLGIGRPTLLTDYPVSLAALSRVHPEDSRLAERFELYVCGVELANAFGELTDPVEQRRRFDADMTLKAKLYGERYPIDEDFLAALDYGLPDCAGIALGVDRLVMLAVGADRIDDVLWAPVA